VFVEIFDGLIIGKEQAAVFINIFKRFAEKANIFSLKVMAMFDDTA